MSKYNISGDTLDVLIAQVADIIRKTESLTLKERAKGNGQYAIWDSKDSYFIPGKAFALKPGVPLSVSATFVFHDLQTAEGYETAMARQITKLDVQATRAMERAEQLRKQAATLVRPSSKLEPAK